MLETVELLIIKFESNLEVWISSLRVRNCNLQLEIRIWNHQNWNKNLYNWSINQKYWLAFQYLETHHFFHFLSEVIFDFQYTNILEIISLYLLLAIWIIWIYFSKAIISKTIPFFSFLLIQTQLDITDSQKVFCTSNKKMPFEKPIFK